MASNGSNEEDLITNDNITLDVTENIKTEPEIDTSQFGKENVVRRPRKEKVHKCRHCSFTTVNDAEFYRHKEQNHFNGGHAFRCEHCSFVTRIKHHLDYHNMSKHSGGIKPYSCDICEYRCINQSMLNSHKRSHQPPCADCNTSKCKCPEKIKPNKRKMDLENVRKDVVDSNAIIHPQMLAYQFQHSFQQNMLQALSRQYMTQFNPFYQFPDQNRTRFPNQFNPGFREPVFTTVRECDVTASPQENNSEDELITDSTQIKIESDPTPPNEISTNLDEDQKVKKVDELTECYPCGILFRSPEMYYEHVKIHSDDSFECSFCGERILSGAALNKHVREHH